VPTSEVWFQVRQTGIIDIKGKDMTNTTYDLASVRSASQPGHVTALPTEADSFSGRMGLTRDDSPLGR